MSLPRIGITAGDPAGIGPEIARKAIADSRVLHVCEPLLYGPRIDPDAHRSARLLAFLYHPPVAVPYYASGCYGCAAAAGAVVGMAAGAAAASANTAAATSSAYAAGVATGSASTAAATSAAYSAGVATGAAAAGAPAGGTYAMGVNYAAVPAGSMTINKNGATYYLSGNTWFQPAYGANGVYYRVVSAP